MDHSIRIVRFLLMVIIMLSAGYFYLHRQDSKLKSPSDFGIDQDLIDRILTEKSLPSDRAQIKTLSNFLPTLHGELICKKAFCLSYREDHELAEWVCYQLSKELIRKPNFERQGYFEPDPEVSTGTGDYYDFSGSGYVRGHLVPVADMSWDQQSMKETFFLSNIAPQAPKFNEGIWKELEECVRDWAYSYDHITIVSGPLLSKDIVKKIGKVKMSVPSAFFKAILVENPYPRAIAFLIPNEKSDLPISHYALSIDELEVIIQIDLFPQLSLDQVESSFDIDQWKFSEERFQKRVESWNK